MADLTHTFAHKLEATRWGRAVVAALIAGATALVLQMVFAAFFDDTAWGPARMVAAIVLGAEILSAWAPMTLGIFLTALLVHFGLAILFAWILVPIIEEMGRTKALVVGAAFGAALFVVNFYLMTAVFPWFTDAREWTTFVTHLVFGAVVAGSYLALRRS